MSKKRTPKPRIALIYGQPGNGKSYLANAELKAKYGYQVLATDDLYVKYIHDSWPCIDFPLLPQFIQQHFHYIVPGASHVRGQDIVRGWVDYLCRTVQEESSKHPLLAVEGYLVTPAVVAELENKLSEQATIVKVEVRGRGYFISNTPDEIHSHDA